MEGNLTKGPILKTLTKLAIPIMASSFLGTLYNITDMAWIGLLGSKAVAGIGVGGMFTWLSQGFASMARMGGQVQVAQCVGRGDKEKAHGYAQAAVQLATVMGLVYALVVLIFTKQMIGFFKLEDPEAYAAAFVYTKIACGLIVFSFLSVTLTGIYTAQGDSKTPFYANLIGLATNMILDPLLILGPGPLPKLGAAGGAIATVTAQFIVMSIMILGIVKQKKENVLKGISVFAKIPAEYLRGICKIGIPTALQGMGILCDLDGDHPYGIRFWCGSDRHTASGRTDRIDLVEYGGRICHRVKCIYRTELWCGRDGTCEEGIPGVAVDGWHLGTVHHGDVCMCAASDRQYFLP